LVESSNSNEDFVGLDEYDNKFDVDLSKNSIIMLGLENVGKSSVVMKYFEKNKSLEDIKNIKPTIYQNIVHKQNLFFGINRSFRVFDLGGQQAYLNKHLEQKPLLNSALCHIWVVDAQRGQKKLVESIKYFEKISDVLKATPTKDRPKVFVLNHKHENEVKDKISLEEVKETFAEHIRIPIESYYETTIFDESIFEALSDIFYKLLAPEVIQQVFHYINLHELIKLVERNSSEYKRILQSQGKLWALKIKENFARQQMGLDPLPTPTTSRALIKKLQLYIIGGNFLFKIPKSQIPSGFTSEYVQLFIDGVIKSTYIHGEINLLNESDDYFEFEITRKN
jgi:GTPase SAR1 family protein